VSESGNVLFSPVTGRVLQKGNVLFSYDYPRTLHVTLPDNIVNNVLDRYLPAGTYDLPIAPTGENGYWYSQPPQPMTPNDFAILAVQKDGNWKLRIAVPSSYGDTWYWSIQYASATVTGAYSFESSTSPAGIFPYPATITVMVHRG